MLCFITVHHENCNSSYEETPQFCTCICARKLKQLCNFIELNAGCDIKVNVAARLCRNILSIIFTRVQTT